MENNQPVDPNQAPNQPHEIKLDSLQATTIAPPTPSVTPTAPTPMPVPAPTTFQSTESIDKQLEQSLSQVPDSKIAESNPKKKYLIMGIVGIAIVVLAFVLYKIFIPSGAATEETPTESTNTLTPPSEEAIEEEPSAKMEELEEVVDDLETIYSKDEPEVFEEAVLEEIPDSETTTETSAESSSDGKVERFK